MTDTTQNQRRSSSYRTGAEAAQTGTGFARSRAGYFSLEDGGRAFVQFVTDPWEWITVDVHSMVKTKAKPDDWEGNWPKEVTPVCRYNKGADNLPMYQDCYVCDNLKDPRDPSKPFKKTARTFALGVMREEVIGDGSAEQGGPEWKGRRRGFRNRMIEMAKLGPDGKILRGADGKPTGETELRPEVVIFMMGWKNFFAALQGAAQSFGGTIVDQTFSITRSGTELATTYTVTPLGPGKQNFNDPKYAERLGIKVDLNDLDTDGHPLKVYPPEYDLVAMIDNRISEEYYARYIDPRVTVASGNKAEPKPTNDVEPENLASMKERIMGWNEASGQSQGEAPAQNGAPTSPPVAAPAAPADDDVDLVGGGGGTVDFDAEP